MKYFINFALVMFTIFFLTDNLIANQCKQAGINVNKAIDLFNKDDNPDYSAVISLFNKAMHQCPDWSVPVRYLGDI